MNPELPQLDFSTFVLGIIGSAYVHLGDAPAPDGSVDQDLELARQNIDILYLLQQKTKGNLTGEEERLVEQALADLKSRYAEVSNDGGAKGGPAR
ncbi:MAG TPA: DUF1844 domain-containing protein [Polyangiaceae bacterium]|jgi:hypothetical protein|nr:DUF1844 domain-containing protein [Polyangiaceae bacterium]